ncbi:ABC transporter ATP-binding protein [Mesorhizobium sp. M1148]|uniref:ABC transporter ATP-binding protein n=1 Tax=unclassified Mesorhizobium TaxID=325217 RepID=UPI0003CE5347|nr:MULTISPECIES: ABC transporter ATP-binding protein [unclassified Mesorhizobium]ESX10511.1 ABC transporter [Mesorhizobium sp. LSJC265A00]ESX20659.1 ABC transporter [Mesorhizobium sp. LSJC255A00]ESX90925.1 ABC transporter [Mesorhizobium sp. LSHC412B00]ESZ46902.1 ABC transporter [Mesorhizobium sp. L2C054A000]
MSTDKVLEVRDLSVDLFTKNGALRPVDRVSYSVRRGETLAIVGESGSGKTVMNFAPLDLMPVGLAVQISGSFNIAGTNIAALPPSSLRHVRGKSVGVIFQDPMSALNPVRRVGRQIAEVAQKQLGLTTRQAEKRAEELLSLVGMSDPVQRMRQYPHELSGGLRQRVMIAIAVASEPPLLIADEPTTALDVTIQAQILKLLQSLQKRLNMGIVLITHDMGVVAAIAHQVAVMYAGRIVEYGPVADVLVSPSHPYTCGLVDAIPREEDPSGSPFRGIAGLPPIMGAPLEACAFAERCAFTQPVCLNGRPQLHSIPQSSVSMACTVKYEQLR